MKNGINKEVPEKLLQNLQNYPHIHSFIKSNWGTVGLKEFLLNLIEDTRNNTRNGFSVLIFESLIKLSFENDNVIKRLGVELDEEDSVVDFAIVKWKLPKNF